MKLFRILHRTVAAPPDRDGAALQSVALTHVGHVRKINEDRTLNLPDLKLWAVADGMGGHHAGDVAAQIAVDALGDLVSAALPLCGDQVIAALQAANALIYSRYVSADQRSGTTIVAALLSDDRLEIFWAGDSRAYRLRSGTLQLLTRDHSVVQEMVDAGALPPDAATRHPRSNIITRALGVDREVVIDRLSTTILAGDIILLCSDGVSRTLDDDVPTAASLEILAQSVLGQALVRDGSDNASLVLVAAG